MNFQRIKALQKEYGYHSFQAMINGGEAWKLEGSYGREAMRLLESGACMLPKQRKVDYYGNTVPSRDDVKAGTKGSYLNCKKFWMAVESGEIELLFESDEILD